jgi:hypothetical protein
MSEKDISISKQVAVEVAIIVLEKLNKEVDLTSLLALSKKFVVWITKDGDNKEVLIQRQAALRRAAMATNVLSLKTSDEILNIATEFYKYF